MKNRLIIILIIGVLFNVTIAKAQVETVVLSNMDSLENYLKIINQNYYEITDAIGNFYEMAERKELSNQNYAIISKYILENEIQIGYYFILDNAFKFKANENMKPIHIMTGESPIIYKILKSLTIDKIQLFIHYILYSDYLNRELSNDQLGMLNTVLRMDGFTQMHKVTQDSTRELNLSSMIRYMNNEK